MNNSVIKVVGQLTNRKNIIHLIAEEDVFPYHKGQIVKSVNRKTFEKLSKKKGEPLKIVL